MSTIRTIIRQLIKEEFENLSENLINRLDGFTEEANRLIDEILNLTGNGQIWADRRGGGAEQVNSNVDQLKHLAGELSSLSLYVTKQYKDKAVAGNINMLANSLNGLAGNAHISLLKRFMKPSQSYIDALREKRGEVQSRIRACKNAIGLLKKKHGIEDKFEFDFNNVT